MTNYTNIIPMPNMTDTTSLSNFFGYINHGTGGIFFPLTLLAIWLVIFISSLSSSGRYSSISRAWTFASFISGILGIMLSALNLLTPRYMYLLGIAFAFGIVWMKLQDSTE